MAARKPYSHWRRLLTALLGIALAFLASGCLWGVITDADTGETLSGVSVTYTDTYGQTATTTTDENGVYFFDQASGPIPAMGPVTFEVEAQGYDPITQPRSVEYNDGLWATLDDLSTFWEVQNFSLSGGSGLYHNGEWGFSVTFPRGWDVEESPYGNGAAATPPVEEMLESFAFVVCEAFAGELPAYVTLESYIELRLTQLRGEVKEFRVREREETQIAGEDATRLVLSGTLEPYEDFDEDFEMSFKDLAYVFRKNVNAYFIECAVFAMDCSDLAIDCPTADQEFDNRLTQFEEVAQSFRFD